VYLLGVPVGAGSFFPYVVSLSGLLQVLLLPITGAVADRIQNKKQLLALFAYLGAIATMGLYLTQGSAYLLGGLLFLISNLSFRCLYRCIQCIPAGDRGARRARPRLLSGLGARLSWRRVASRC
jgi:hypothetical protein